MHGTQEENGELSKGNKDTRCCTAEPNGDQKQEIVFSIIQHRDSEGKWRYVLLGEYDKERGDEKEERGGWTYTSQKQIYSHAQTSRYTIWRHGKQNLICLALTSTFLCLNVSRFLSPSTLSCHCVSVVFPVCVTLSSLRLPSSYLFLLSKQTSDFPSALHKEKPPSGLQKLTTHPFLQQF